MNSRRLAAFGLVTLLGPLVAASCALDEYGAIDLGGRACFPESASPCYTGPQATRGVGQCVIGNAVCRIDGTFGACVGEVLPGVEDCFTPTDEDCDGLGRGDTECLCQPGEAIDCDTGALGACKAGKRHCPDDGLAYGDCVAGAEPMQEDCALVADENCDGQAPVCTGNPLVSREAGGVVSDVAFALATNGIAHAVAGVTGGDVLGRDVLTGSMYVERRDVKLDVGWTVPASSIGGRAVARGVAVTPKGALVAAGQFSGQLTIGSGMTLNAGGDDIFLFGTNTLGKVLWAKSFGDVNFQAANAIALGPGGFLAMAGEAWGTVDFGSGGPKMASGGDAFVAVFDAQGNHAWSRFFGDSALQRALGAAVTPGGDVLVVGDFDGTIDTGAGLLVSSGGDAFVARLKSVDGSTIWAQKFGDDIFVQRAWAVASGPFGEVAITGEFGGAMTVGQTKLVADSPSDVFVVVLEADGAFRWAKRLGDAAGVDQVGNAVAFDGVGNVLVTGSFDGAIDFGAGAVPSVGKTDVFLAKFAGKSGDLVWGKRVGDAEEQRGYGVAAGVSAQVLAAGGFYGTLDWGMPAFPLTSAGAADIFVTTFEP